MLGQSAEALRRTLAHLVPPSDEAWLLDDFTWDPVAMARDGAVFLLCAASYAIRLARAAWCQRQR